MTIRAAHAGGAPEGYDVTTVGTRVAEADSTRKWWSCVNASDEPVYLALRTNDSELGNPAVVGRGVYLAPSGGSFELNGTNMYHGEIWAIHGDVGVKRLCVQPGG